MPSQKKKTKNIKGTGRTDRRRDVRSESISCLSLEKEPHKWFLAMANEIENLMALVFFHTLRHSAVRTFSYRVVRILDARSPCLIILA